MAFTCLLFWMAITHTEICGSISGDSAQLGALREKLVERFPS